MESKRGFDPIYILVGGILVWMLILSIYVFMIIRPTDESIDDHKEIIGTYSIPLIVEEVVEDDYFYHTSPIKLGKDDLYCLQRNVFFEAGIESYEGKLAVAQVTLNRLETGRWGQTVCSVVFAKAQFSWTLWQKNRTKTPHGPLWEDSKRVVQDFIDGIRLTDIVNSLHYHADYIEPPRWADTDRQVTQIGYHIFYER